MIMSVIKNIKTVILLPLLLASIAVLLGYTTPALASTTQQDLKKALPFTQGEQRFITKMVKKYHFNKKSLSDLLAQADYLPNTIDHMNHPFEAKPWDFYRKHFIRPKRIKLGVLFWKKYATELKRVQHHYGVDPAIIVALIGVESMYGEHTGTYPELSTLVTLAFHYPKRATFFQCELREYLLLTREQHLSPLKLKGSYAGALGIPQFMPSSYHHYAAAYRGQKRSINLLFNSRDAIASVANYLAKSGWKSGRPVAEPVIGNHGKKKWVNSKRHSTNSTLGQLAKHNVCGPDNLPKQTKAALIKLHAKQGEQYWITFPNFYAIMAYNPSVNYSMAVYQLSGAIQQAYEQANA